MALNSGRDATLNGAQVTGNKVTADIGRDLLIRSQQDSDCYDSKQTSFGAGGSFVNNPPAGTLTKVRNNGETVYYNPSTNTFAVKRADGAPKTMFKPDPADHGYKTNLDYFNAQ